MSELRFKLGNRILYITSIFEIIEVNPPNVHSDYRGMYIGEVPNSTLVSDRDHIPFTVGLDYEIRELANISPYIELNDSARELFGEIVRGI